MLFALPAASLMSVLIAFLRLSADNEMIALNSSGISLYQLFPPVLAISIAGFLITSSVSLFGVPWGNRSFRDLVLKIAEEKAGVGVKQRVFTEIFDDIVFYINSVSSKGRVMKDVFVADRRERATENTIVAKEYRIIKHPESRMITLRFADGTIFFAEADLKSARTLRFQTYDLNIDLNDFMPSLSLRKKAPREMYIQELIEELDVSQKGSIESNEIVVELMERFSIPVTVFLLGLIALPLGAQIRAGARSFGVGLSLAIFLVYCMCLLGTKSLCQTGTLSPYLGMWFPNLFLMVCFVFLVGRSVSGRALSIWRSHDFRRGVKRADSMTISSTDMTDVHEDSIGISL